VTKAAAGSFEVGERFAGSLALLMPIFAMSTRPTKISEYVQCSVASVTVIARLLPSEATGMSNLKGRAEGFWVAAMPSVEESIIMAADVLKTEIENGRYRCAACVGCSVLRGAVACVRVTASDRPSA